MIRLGQITDFSASTGQVRRWCFGRIVMQAGKFVRLERRLMCGSASMAQVWWQAKYGRTDDDILWLDYHSPMGMPGFLTLDYIRSGKKAGYRSLIGATEILNEVARVKGAQAIVAHISNAKITDNFLTRIGWQQHLTDWKGRHWIRRFYDGYPESRLHRYA